MVERHLAKVDVAGPTPVFRSNKIKWPEKRQICGNSSVVERHLAKVDVAGPTPVFRSNKIKWPEKRQICGNSSVVERHLAKVDVAGPTPVFRSKFKSDSGRLNRFFVILGRIQILF